MRIDPPTTPPFTATEEQPCRHCPTSKVACCSSAPVVVTSPSSSRWLRCGRGNDATGSPSTPPTRCPSWSPRDVTWAHHPTTRNVPNLARNTALARKVIDEQRPDVIVSTGAAVAYPFFLLGRAKGIPTVYVEVYDRIDSRTRDRSAVPSAVSTLFCVQWEEQQRALPGLDPRGAAAVSRILVTVGTDHHPFQRLVDWADAVRRAPPRARGLHPVRLSPSASVRRALTAARPRPAADARSREPTSWSATEARQPSPTSAQRAPARSASHATPTAGSTSTATRCVSCGASRRPGMVTRTDVDSSTASTRRSPPSWLDHAASRVRPRTWRRASSASHDLIAELTARPSADGDDGPIRVIYLGGQGRSGTTLLERALGELPGVLSVGETVHLWDRGLRDNQLCGCGEPFHSVLVLAVGGRRRIRRLGHPRRRRGGVAALRGRPQPVPAAARPSRAVPSLPASATPATSTRLAQLYRAIAEVSGSRVIIDSSKHASYALMLSQVPGLDLRLLHVVRDSRAVAHAWTKDGRQAGGRRGSDADVRTDQDRRAVGRAERRDRAAQGVATPTCGSGTRTSSRRPRTSCSQPGGSPDSGTRRPRWTSSTGTPCG